MVVVGEESAKVGRSNHVRVKGFIVLGFQRRSKNIQKIMDHQTGEVDRVRRRLAGSRVRGEYNSPVNIFAILFGLLKREKSM